MTGVHSGFALIKGLKNWTWWYMPIVPVFKRRWLHIKLEDPIFKNKQTTPEQGVVMFINRKHTVF